VPQVLLNLHRRHPCFIQPPRVGSTQIVEDPNAVRQGKSPISILFTANTTDSVAVDRILSLLYNTIGHLSVVKFIQSV
jgi:hypothetical protein